VWSLLLNSLIQRLGVSWTFRILGFIVLGLGLPAAFLLRERTHCASPSFEWRLFFDWKFFLLFIGSGIGTFPLLVPAFFIPLYATPLHASTFLASFFPPILNLSSASGRIGFGLLCDHIGPITSLGPALVLRVISMLAIWPVSSSLGPFIACTIINSAGNGEFFSTVPSVVGHVYGSACAANTLAMVVLVGVWLYPGRVHRRMDPWRVRWLRGGARRIPPCDLLCGDTLCGRHIAHLCDAPSDAQKLEHCSICIEAD